MNLKEVVVPSPGESINQVLLSRWLVEDGQFVEKNSDVAEIDSDKATLVISADVSGVIKFIAQEGETVDVGAVVATIDESQQNDKPQSEITPEAPKEEEKPETIEEKKEKDEIKLTPLAKSILESENISQADFEGFLKGKKVGSSQVKSFLSNQSQSAEATADRTIDRVKMTPLRSKLSERLVAVKNETAMLTTFNEVDMSAFYELKEKYSDEFKASHEVGIGLMSYFTKAATIALQHFPQVNSQIDGDSILNFNYTDIGIAVSAPKGLVVPVIRDTHLKTIPQLEKDIKAMAIKARDGKISLDDMAGGTFTITNGGVFGSLFSTPIINPPQSAILGMHNVVDRPVALNGQVVIRPMMYIALSYDHRIIDGKDSVSFLKMIKTLVENPSMMANNGRDVFKTLLDIE